jgi:glycosyltransferase involved in cell wall biosynthesis
MKVLYMVNIPSPYRIDFFNELAKYCELTVLIERENATDREKSWKGCMNNSYKTIFLKSIKISNDSSISFEAINHIKANIYDVIVFGVYHTITAMLTMEYLHLHKIKFILNSDGGFIKNDSKIAYFIKKHYISMANAYLSTGKQTSKYLEHYGANLKNIYTYPFTSLYASEILSNVITVSQKEKIRRRLKIKEKKIVLTVCRLLPLKGIDVLLEAVSKMNTEAGIYIIGGEPTSEYKTLMTKLNLKNIHFVNFKSKSELVNYYSMADVFVLPTRSDVWGLVINEAMAHGLPVITTEMCNAGIEMIRDPNNGFVIKINDSDSLAKKIDYILGNQEIQDRMSVSSIQIAKYYTIENMAKIHYKFFEDWQV